MPELQTAVQVIDRPPPPPPPAPEASSPVPIESPSLAARLQARMESTPHTASFLHAKETPAGNRTYSLTTQGKEMGKVLYEEIASNTNATQLQAETHAIRLNINQNLHDTRKQKRADLTTEWKLSGKKKAGNMDTFNQELKQRLENDQQVQRYQLERKLLASITQRAKAAVTKEAREAIRSSLTNKQRQTVLQTLVAEGKKVPASIALQDTLVTAWLMRHQEQPTVAEPEVVMEKAVVPAKSDLVIARSPEPVDGRRGNLPDDKDTKLVEAAEATRRAELAVTRIRLRYETRSKAQQAQVAAAKNGLGSRWRDFPKNAGEYFRGLNQRRRLLVASALIASSSLFPTAVNLSHADVAHAFASPPPATTEMAKAPTQVVEVQATWGPSIPAPQEKAVPKITTYGEVTAAKPTFYRSGTNEQVAMQMTDKKVEVLHPTGNKRFLVQTPSGQLEMPITQLDIQGPLSWEKDIKPLDWLGFDNTDVATMDKVVELGAGSVRISLNQAIGELDKNSPLYLGPAIESAKAKNLDILLTYIPGGPLSDQEASKRIDAMLSTVQGYNKVSIEIGNEPDVPPFWKDNNLDTFAQFVNQTMRLIREKNSTVKFVVGAASQKEAVAPLIQALKRHNVNLNDLTLAVHAYNSVAEVNEKLDIINKQAPGVKTVFTEIGSNTPAANKGQNTIRMVEEARRRGAEKNYVFQLGNAQFVEGNGNWGYVDDQGRRMSIFWDLTDWTWGKTHPAPTSATQLRPQ